MISPAHMIEALKPIAPTILALDARAIARLAERKSDYAGLDPQPVAAAIANERRAIVGTGLRTSMATFGWEQHMEHHLSGAYEWTKDGVAIRLSKTTPQSRREDAAALLGLQGIQTVLFPTTADPNDQPDAILVRLMGHAFEAPRVDAAALDSDGQKRYSISLRAIAKASTEQVANRAEPADAAVSLPRITLPKAPDTRPG